MTETVVALDLGSSKVACLAAELEHGRPRVTGMGVTDSQGIRKGTIFDPEAAGKCVAEVVRQVEEELGREVHSFVVGVSGQHVEGVAAKGFVPILPDTRSITHDDVLQAINHSRTMVLPEDREQILALPAEFRVDGKGAVATPIGHSGGRLEVTTFLATAETTRLEDLERTVRAAGKEVEQIVPIALAGGLGVLTAEQLHRGAVSVDIGYETTNVAVFKYGSVMASAWIPVGGMHITSDIAKLLKTAPEDAEKLKRENGSATSDKVGEDESIGVLQIGHIGRRELPRKVFCEIIECRVLELAELVKAQTEKWTVLADLRSGLVLTGGGSLLPDIAELFARVLDPLPATLGRPHPRGPRGYEAQRPELAAVVGLARFALECDKEELAPAGTNGKWRDKIRTFLSLLGSKA